MAIFANLGGRGPTDCVLSVTKVVPPFTLVGTALAAVNLATTNHTFSKDRRPKLPGNWVPPFGAPLGHRLTLAETTPLASASGAVGWGQVAWYSA
jgi:hypothetical protein